MTVITLHIDGEPWIVCKHTAEGSTHRRAIAGTVQGSALLGPARFPIPVPEISGNERRIWRRGSWWIVVPRAKRRATA